MNVLCALGLLLLLLQMGRVFWGFVDEACSIGSRVWLLD